MSDKSIWTRAQSGIEVVETFIDRAVGIINPGAELERVRARRAVDQIRGYEGAKHGRRTANWRTGDSYVNDIIKGGLPTLRARSRDLVRNNPWVNKGLNTIVNHTVGVGIRPSVKGKKDTRYTRIVGLWEEWGETTLCDADGLSSFYGMQALVLRTVGESGSCLIRRRRRRTSDNLPVPLQLQVLEPDYLDATKDTLGSTNGNIIVHGIEFDRRGRRVAYHLYNEHPGSNFYNRRSTRVPAEDIIHVFRVERAGQAEGVPWTSPIIIRVRDLDEYEDADLIRQKIAACFVAFVQKTDDNDEGDEEELERRQKVQPGMIEYLGNNESIQFGTPPASPDTGSAKRSLLSISAGLGITYESLTNDYSNVNFSSGRMGRLEMQANIDVWRRHMMIPRLCSTTWRWFIEGALLTGAIKEGRHALWTPPRREMLDPVKETMAKRAQVRAGFKSWSEAIREEGRDPDEVLEEIASDYHKMKEKGVPLEAFAGTLPTPSSDSE